MPTISTLVGRYIGQRERCREISPLTVTSLRCNLGNFAKAIGDPPITDLARSHIEAWIDGADLAPATLRTRLSQVKGLCAWAVEEGYLDRDPVARIKGPPQPRLVPRALRSTDVRALLGACGDPRTELVVLLMLQEGLRRKEVAGLAFGDIDLEESLALVRGKANHERVVPLSGETLAALHRYLEERPATAGPLVRSYHDDRSGLAPVTIGRMVSAAMWAAGVKRFAYDGRSAHACRHTMATDMLRKGANLRDVQVALGHASLAATQRYLAWAVGDLRTAMGGRTYGRRGAPSPKAG